MGVNLGTPKREKKKICQSWLSWWKERLNFRDNFVEFVWKHIFRSKKLKMQDGEDIDYLREITFDDLLKSEGCCDWKLIGVAGTWRWQKPRSSWSHTMPYATFFLSRRRIWYLLLAIPTRSPVWLFLLSSSLCRKRYARIHGRRQYGRLKIQFLAVQRRKNKR